jgi:antitoxin VapB
MEPTEWYTYTMALNIKNNETQRLVQKLAKLTGESQTAAITTAVRERISRLQRERKEGLAKRLLAIGKECAPLFKEPYKSAEHGDLLYGEDGLPR